MELTKDQRRLMLDEIVASMSRDDLEDSCLDTVRRGDPELNSIQKQFDACEEWEKECWKEILSGPVQTLREQAKKDPEVGRRLDEFVKEQFPDLEATELGQNIAAAEDVFKEEEEEEEGDTLN